MKKWTVEIPIAPKSVKDAEDEHDGITTTVRIGSEHVVASGIQATDKEAAKGLAIEAVNWFLNQLALCCGVAHEVAFEGRSSKIVDEEAGTTSLILQETVAVRGRVIRKAMDANGNVVSVHDSDRPGKLPGLHTEAMSYLRRGMLAEHIHERLRNYCLAIENIASWICKRDGVRGGEFKCVQHALVTVYREERALRNLKAVWAGKPPDQDESLSERIYRQVRCQLAHAKDGEDKRMPYDEKDIKSMREDEDLVERVARDLIEYQLSALK